MTYDPTTNPVEREMDALVEQAKAILRVSVNPAMDRDDWEPCHAIPSTPSLN
jgi:hypothetical protein